MENEKELVTLSELRKHIRKSTIAAALVFIIVWPLLSWGFNATYAASNILLLKILYIVFILTGILGLAECIYIAIRSRKSGYFTVRTDTLLEKQEHIRIAYRQYGNRLRFMQGAFDISNRAMDPYIEPAPYNISMKAVWDTAFIGDSFTLIVRNKTILYAFNDKLYQIVDDL